MSTAKEKLQEIQKLDKAIKYKLEIADDLRQGKLPCIAMDKIGSSGTFISNPTMNTALKISKLSEQVDRDIDKLCDLKCEVEKALRKHLNASEYEICYLRYFKYKRWNEIADETSYSLRGVHRIHIQALIKLDELILEEFYK